MTFKPYHVSIENLKYALGSAGLANSDMSNNMVALNLITQEFNRAQDALRDEVINEVFKMLAGTRYMGQDGHGGGYKIRPEYELRMQTQAAALLQKNGGFKQYLGSPDAPLVCVKGNHDFAALRLLFADCKLVKEFKNNEVVEVLGLKITGHRGVPPINGAWADETSVADLTDRLRAFDPTCDLYLTHYPPAGIGLDLPGNWGLGGMVNWFGYNLEHHALHCHGHIHECAGLVKHALKMTYSNAATTYNIIEGSRELGWKDAL